MAPEIEATHSIAARQQTLVESAKALRGHDAAPPCAEPCRGWEVVGNWWGELGRSVEGATAPFNELDPEPPKLRPSPTERRLGDQELVEDLAGVGGAAPADEHGDR